MYTIVDASELEGIGGAHRDCPMCAAAVSRKGDPLFELRVGIRPCNRVLRILFSRLIRNDIFCMGRVLSRIDCIFALLRCICSFACRRAPTPSSHTAAASGAWRESFSPSLRSFHCCTGPSATQEARLLDGHQQMLQCCASVEMRCSLEASEVHESRD